MSTPKSSPSPTPLSRPSAPDGPSLSLADRTFLLSLLQRDTADLDSRCLRYRRRLCLRQQTFLLALFFLLVVGGRKALAVIPQPASARIVTTCTQSCPSEQQLHQQINRLIHSAPSQAL